MLNKIFKVKKGSKNFYDPRRRFFTSKYIYFLMYQMKTFAKSNLEKIYTYNHQKNGVEGFFLLLANRLEISSKGQRV